MQVGIPLREQFALSPVSNHGRLAHAFPVQVKCKRISVILALLAVIGPFSVDTYFASFPDIAAHFRITELRVQQTLSFYLVALAAMNLFHGSLSDCLGRRPVIVLSLVIYTVSAVISVVVENFELLLLLRSLQGLSAGSGMIVGRAIIRDCFAGPEAHKAMAQVTAVSGIGPIAAPIVGGWLHLWFGWRGPFVFLAFLGAALWAMCFFGLPETLTEESRQPFHASKLLRSYLKAICHPAFILICLSVGLGGGGFLLYVATAPDVVLNILKLSGTQFGWVFVPMVSGLIAGSALSARLAARVPAGKLVFRGFCLMALGAAINMVVSLWFMRLPWAVIGLPVYTFGFALMAPVATIQALDLNPTRKGLASSLQGFIQTLIFAAMAAFVSKLVHGSAPRHGVALLILMAFSYLAWYGYAALSPRDDSPNTDEMDPAAAVDPTGSV